MKKKLNEAEYNISINNLETDDASALSQMFQIAATAEKQEPVVDDSNMFGEEPLGNDVGFIDDTLESEVTDLPSNDIGIDSVEEDKLFEPESDLEKLEPDMEEEFDIIDEAVEVQPDMFDSNYDETYVNGRKVLDFENVLNTVKKIDPSLDYTYDKELADGRVIMGFSTNTSKFSKQYFVDVKNKLKEKFGEDIDVKLASYKYAPEMKEIHVIFYNQLDNDELDENSSFEYDYNDNITSVNRAYELFKSGNTKEAYFELCNNGMTKERAQDIMEKWKNELEECDSNKLSEGIKNHLPNAEFIRDKNSKIAVLGYGPAEEMRKAKIIAKVKFANGDTVGRVTEEDLDNFDEYKQQYEEMFGTLEENFELTEDEKQSLTINSNGEDVTLTKDEDDDTFEVTVKNENGDDVEIGSMDSNGVSLQGEEPNWNNYGLDGNEVKDIFKDKLENSDEEMVEEKYQLNEVKKDSSLLRYIGSLIENGYYSGFDPTWSLNATVNGHNIEEFGEGLRSYLANECSYPVKDGYDSYEDVEVNINASTFVDDEDMIEDLKQLFDESEIRNAIKNDDELQCYVSYNIDYQSDETDEEMVEESINNILRISGIKINESVKDYLPRAGFIKHEDEKVGGFVGQGTDEQMRKAKIIAKVKFANGDRLGRVTKADLDNFDDYKQQYEEIYGTLEEERQKNLPHIPTDKSLYLNKKSKKENKNSPKYTETEMQFDGKPGKDATKKLSVKMEKTFCESKINNIYNMAKKMYKLTESKSWDVLDRRYVTKFMRNGVSFSKASDLILKAKQGK